MQSEQPWYIDPAELAAMPFPQVAEAWLVSRTPYISKKIFHEYQQGLASLKKMH
jgi:hypothetical protein